MPVRRVGVTLSQLMDDQDYQLTLFEDQVKSRALEKATDSIKKSIWQRRNRKSFIAYRCRASGG